MRITFNQRNRVRSVLHWINAPNYGHMWSSQPFFVCSLDPFLLSKAAASMNPPFLLPISSDTSVNKGKSMTAEQLEIQSRHRAILGYKRNLSPHQWALS